MNYSFLKKSGSFRLIIIGVLCLVLLIPLAMITSLISEREMRRNGAIDEVSEKWGKAQTIAGPVLTVPFKRYSENNMYREVYSVEYAHFLPDDLSINGTINTSVRHRGIYEVVLYNTVLKLTGSFSLAEMEDLKIPMEDFLWKDAFLSVGITDMKGIRETIKITWNESEYIAGPGIASDGIFDSGVSTEIMLTPDKDNYLFSLDLNINGSKQLYFIPVGKETNVSVSSNWNNPGFTGEFLPENRQITKDGFSADWKILHLNRNYPQQWTGKQCNVDASSFGADLLLPVDEYQKTMRTAKYAILFIALTFLAFFMIEVLQKRSVHPVQYLMIGLALVLFYTLLLSLSEHLAFNISYLLSSVSVVFMISAYTKGFSGSSRPAVMIAGTLTTLYGFLYVLLQLQDYSLLLGNTGLFVTLAVIMYMTRKLDWSAVWNTNE